MAAATYDKRHGWRKPTRNVLDEKHTIDGYKKFSLYGDNPNGDPAKANAFEALSKAFDRIKKELKS